jgi:hypothetical protein
VASYKGFRTKVKLKEDDTRTFRPLSFTICGSSVGPKMPLDTIS